MKHPISNSGKGGKMIVLIILVSMMVLLSLTKKKQKDIISIYFGVPGSGKTTICAHLVKKCLKRGEKVWSNVPITGAYKLEPKDDIGINMIADGKVIIDEAGIEYNNRDFKTFSKNSLYFYKYHRHYKTSIDFFSQGWDDCDKKIRDLAQRLYIVKPSIIPYFIYRKRLAKKIGIDENGQIIDQYSWVPFGKTYYFAPSVWKMFNTLSRKEFPEKEWETW